MPSLSVCQSTKGLIWACVCVCVCMFFRARWDSLAPTLEDTSSAQHCFWCRDSSFVKMTQKPLLILARELLSEVFNVKDLELCWLQLCTSKMLLIKHDYVIHLLVVIILVLSKSDKNCPAAPLKHTCYYVMSCLFFLYTLIKRGQHVRCW